MKLTFIEERAGWDVQFITANGGFFHTARLEFSPALEQWIVDFTEGGVYFTLSELDQIRHKLANLEATRLAKLELEKSK